MKQLKWEKELQKNNFFKNNMSIQINSTGNNNFKAIMMIQCEFLIKQFIHFLIFCNDAHLMRIRCVSDAYQMHIRFVSDAYQMQIIYKSYAY